MQRDPERVISFDIIRETVNDRLAFCFEGSEYFVPNDQKIAEVPIDILRVRAMMNAVMSWRHEDMF